MEYVVLRNGVEFPILGFGTWPLKSEILHNSFKHAFASGCRLFDTADMYENEIDLGNAIKGNFVKREELFLTSKLRGKQYNGQRRFLYLNKESVRASFRKSCKKLNTSYLDLYLLHSPFENYLKAYGELIKLMEIGKVRAIGVCNFDISRLESIKQIYGDYPLVNQIELHPFNQQTEIVQFCKKNNIQVEAYSPFAHGVIMSELLSNDTLNVIAKSHNKKVSQIILRWLIQLKIVTIPRSSSRAHIEENYNIFDFVLSDEEMSQIKALDRRETHSTFSKNSKL